MHLTFTQWDLHFTEDNKVGNQTCSTLKYLQHIFKTEFALTLRDGLTKKGTAEVCRPPLLAAYQVGRNSS